MLASCGVEKDSAIDRVKETPTRSYVSDLGEIRFDKNGTMRLSDESVVAVTIDIYFDAACAACAKYTELTSEEIEKSIERISKIEC